MLGAGALSPFPGDVPLSSDEGLPVGNARRGREDRGPRHMMTKTPRVEKTSEPDSHLWQLVCQGSAHAFEVLVRRHQSLVCSVAYCACGDLALSEDVAQETFWTAWRQRESLERPDRLTAWLCGIARNLAKNARRKASRPVESADSLDVLGEFSTDLPSPDEEAVTREEEALVWQALERIPETYREPLILFYREDQSVAEVAGALVLSEDAVKQRLSRGRGLLRERVAELVESGLRRSRPGRKFTVTVIAGLSAHAAGTKTALAGAGAGAGLWKAAAIAGAGGALGGLLGSLGGLLGGWLGAWVPAQVAPTLRERDAILRAGWRTVLVSIVFIVALIGLIYTFAGKPSYIIAWGGWMVAFWAYIAVESVRLVREVKHIRAAQDPNDLPNETALRAGLTAMAERARDRAYRSEATFLGLPLIDINWSAPMPLGAGKHSGSAALGTRPRIARGWIAIGVDARGILLAIGSTARGLVALGGRAFGVVSIGGVALGVVAIGGLGLGVLGIGGLGAGMYAFGGGAVGWRAAGGLAVGWDLACGGGAFAGRAAIGGAAIARDYAVGGEARARHANDQAAREVILDHSFTRFAFTVLGQRKALERLAGGGFARAPEPPPAAAGQFALDNGLTVRIRPIKGANNVALLVLHRIGGDHDPQERSGLAHLVEHLYVTAAAGGMKARTAEGFFQQYPAGCNAQTGDRYTVIATVFPKGELEKELTEAAARMGNLHITADDLDREKPRLLEEVSNMFGRFPALGAVNNARELIRPTPRGGRKGGVPEHVQSMTLDEVRAHWTLYYKPRNAIVVLAGAVDEAAARQAVTAHFAKLEPGEDVPKPGEPGPPKAGTVRELAVKSLQGQAEPTACLAYAAPEPGSELYAPFLVLVTRFYSAAAQPGGGGGSGRQSVYFPLLEDPAVLGVSAATKRGESAAIAIARLESFVADTIAPRLRDEECASVRQMFGMILGTAEVPDFALAQNPYGAALSLARREQMGIDTVKLNGALDNLTDADVRRAAQEIFSPDRHAGAFVSPER
jgi:RNA polymerase sigma factor (sigma-70 family)